MKWFTYLTGWLQIKTVSIHGLRLKQFWINTKESKMDKVTVKWWIDHSKELEDENRELRQKLEAALDTVAYQETELRRLERLQPY